MTHLKIKEYFEDGGIMLLWNGDYIPTRPHGV